MLKAQKLAYIADEKDLVGRIKTSSITLKVRYILSECFPFIPFSSPFFLDNTYTNFFLSL